MKNKQQRYYEYPEQKLEKTEKAKELFEKSIEKYRKQCENVLWFNKKYKWCDYDEEYKQHYLKEQKEIQYQVWACIEEYRNKLLSINKIDSEIYNIL